MEPFCTCGHTFSDHGYGRRRCDCCACRGFTSPFPTRTPGEEVRHDHG